MMHKQIFEFEPRCFAADKAARRLTGVVEADVPANSDFDLN